MSLNEYETKVISDKLKKAQDKLRARLLTLKDVEDFILDVEAITKELVKYYDSSKIKICFCNGVESGKYILEGTTIISDITKDGLVDLDKLIIGRDKLIQVKRIELVNFTSEIDDIEKRRELRKKFNINNHSHINI